MTSIVVLVMLASELPDPGRLAFPGVCGTFGGFVGMAVGMGRRLPWERTTQLAAQGGVVGYGVGFVGWLTAVAIDRL